jgi:hypothetical protein
MPEAEQGILDLKNWDLEENGIVNLNGEWEFYWEKLLEPDDFAGKSIPEMSGFIKVPGIWNGYEVTNDAGTDNHILGGDGFATYRLTIVLNNKNISSASGECIGLKIPYMFTSYRMWINGKLISSNGKVGMEKSETIPQHLPNVGFFRTDNREVDLVVQVANFSHRKGGLMLPITMGTESKIQKLKSISLYIELFLFGSLLIMAFYHFGLYLFRKKDIYTLFFSLFCVIVLLRILLSGEYFFVSLFPNINWELCKKIEYLSFYLGTGIFSIFLFFIYPKRIPKPVIKTIVYICVIFSLFVLAVPARIYTYSKNPFIVVALFCIVFFMYILIKAAIDKEEGAVLILIGASVLAIAIISDILYSFAIHYYGYIIPFGFFIFILFQSYMLLIRFTKALKTVEILTEDLEQQVEQRTTELTKTNSDLKEALANVNTLKGLIPICARCKKVRDDKGYWHQVEEYISKRSDVDFSHGICPECVEKFYPELLHDE